MKNIRITFEDGSISKDIIPENEGEILNFLYNSALNKYVNIRYDKDLKTNVIQILSCKYKYAFIKGELCEIINNKELNPICKNLYTAFLILREKAGEWE
jgi:hypothetical protein